MLHYGGLIAIKESDTAKNSTMERSIKQTEQKKCRCSSKSSEFGFEQFESTTNFLNNKASLKSS